MDEKRLGWFSRLLGRFIPETTLGNIREGVRHPVRWVRGEGIPPDHITPWELLLYFFHDAFKTMSGGFTGKQDFLFKEVYRVPPNLMSVAGVVSSIWDAANDPLLGSWMDKKRLGPQALRTIMRISAVTGSIAAVVKMLDGGLSPWQHVFLLMACNMLQDIIGTMSGVADQKIRAGISPLTQQRGRVSVWSNMGMQLTWHVAALPTLFMGFREVFGWTDYQIIFIGALLLLPFSAAAWILPTFVRQRVDYSGYAPAEEGAAPEKRSWTDTFRVIRHNRYFIFNSIASFITVFSPDVGDELLVYRYLVPKLRVFGRQMSGEGVLLIKQYISGFPSTLLQPFNRQIINRMGGPLRAQKLNSFIIVISKAIQYFVGCSTVPRLAVMILTETFINASRNLDGIAGSMLGYEFYDHVELQTGERSEGVTTAINGLFSKIITGNIGLVTGNAFLQWTGYRGGYTQEGTRPPDRYMRWMWPMYTLIPVIDNSIWFAARHLVKWTPEDRDRTEQALAERRAAARSLREEMDKEPLPSQ